MRNGKERADILATELNKHALDLHKELSKQLSKHRQLRCFVEGDDFNDKNESSLFSKYGSEETIDGYVFDIYKLQKATELYSKQDAIYNPCRDSYDVVSLARQILFDCNVFNKEKYTKLQKQVDVMLYNEIKKQIDIIIQNGNFDNDTINFLYNAYGDGNQFQLEKFDGLLAVFLETDDVYNDIESLASKILLSYGVTSSDEIDRDNSEVSYDSETERVLDNGLDIYAKEINDSNLKKEFIEQEVELKLGERKFYFEDLKYPDQNNPDCGHRKIRAFLPSETAPAGLEEINIKDRHSFETASLYASYICDQKDFRYKESTVNPALLMFKLKENGEGNFNKLKSHLYHQAMLVHVDDEIYLLRKDQEKLVSMIFPGRKITSVLMITKDKNGNVIHEVNNEYYDFTEDDVNKTLEYFRDKSMDKNKGEQDAGLKLVGDHRHYTRSQAQKVKVKKEEEEDLGSSAGKRDGETIPSHYTRSQAQKVKVKEENLGSSAGKRKRDGEEIPSHYTRSEAHKVKVKEENLGLSAGKRKRDGEEIHSHNTRSKAQKVKVKEENLGSSAGKSKKNDKNKGKKYTVEMPNLGYFTKHLNSQEVLAPKSYSL